MADWDGHSMTELRLPCRDKQAKAAGFAYAQLRLQLSQHWGTLIAVNSLNEKLHSFCAQLMLGQFHRRQAWPKDAEPWVVVEADQAEIVRALQAHLFRRF